MEMWTEFRRRVLTGELSKRAACQEYGINWRTLGKMLAHAEPPGYRRRAKREKPILGPHLAWIHEVLEQDKKAPKKQHHTAQRIFDRLKAERDYTGGVTMVKAAVREWKDARKEVFVPLSHPPGEAQVDFGFAYVDIAGERQQVALFVMTLPYSDSIFIQAFPRECTKAYVASRTDVKPATKEVWRQGEKGMVDFLGVNAALRDVTPGDADRYKLHMIGSKLAPMTIRKRLQFATMVFRAAVRQRLIVDSPFTGVTVKGTMPNRERFVTLDETRLLLIACPNHHWRSVISLARYGGLRCPSEVLSLRWEDIDWAGGKILVTSPKTEHHPGKGTRRIPLFPELKAVLEEALNLAEKGAVYVVKESMREACRGPGGWMNVNLRTTFLKIIKRAGLAQWPRLFHNLRSSRQTELAETFPAHVVCDWLGNSEAVAMKHYLQTTDDHFSRAAGGSPKAKQSRAADDDDAPANPKVDRRAEAKQKAKQSGAAKARTDSLRETTNPGIADRNETRRLDANTKTDGVGFEPTNDFRRCRFSRSAKPLRALPKRTPR